MWDRELCYIFLETFGYGHSMWARYLQYCNETSDSSDDTCATQILLEKVREDALVDIYIDRFINRTDYYNFQKLTAEGRVIYPRQHSQLTRELIQQHIAGSITLSFAAGDKQGLSKWCSWDSDTDDGSLERIKALLRELKLKPLREARREGRAGHSWLLLEEQVSVEELRAFNSLLQDDARTSIEFFPASDKPDRAGQLRGPLSRHYKRGCDGERGWFEGAAKDIDSQLVWLSEQSLNPTACIKEIAAVKLASDQQSKIQNKSYYKPFTSAESSDVDWFSVFSDWSWNGREYFRQCPLCEREGLDRSEDNLRLSADKLLINCVYGGPDQFHRTKDLYKLVSQRTPC